MSKTPPVPPLPPLPFDVLGHVQDFEEYAISALRDCNLGIIFNGAKALRILRTCVVSVFGRQLKHYSSLPEFHRAWVAEIKGQTIDSAIAMLPPGANHQGITVELSRTIDDHLEEKAKAQQSALIPSPSANIEPLSKQLAALRIESGLTYEQVAEGVDLALRSVHRHLAGDVLPSRRHLATYEKFFSATLKRQVQLTTPPRIKTPPKTSSQRH